MKECQNGGSVSNILMPLGFTIIAHWLADSEGKGSSDRQVSDIEQSLFKKYGKNKGNRESKKVYQKGGVLIDDELLRKAFDDALKAQGLDLSINKNLGDKLIKEVKAAIANAKRKVFDEHVESIRKALERAGESNEEAIREAAVDEWKELIGEWLDENKDILELIEKIQPPPPIQSIHSRQQVID